MNVKERNFDMETISAIFCVSLLTTLIMANFVVGFVLPFYLMIMIPAFLISFFYPRSGIYAIVFLTFIFERFFTLSAVFIGKTEYKIYPLDVIFIAVILGAIAEIFKNQVKIKFEKNDKILMIFMGLIFLYFLFSFFGKISIELAFSTFKHYFFYPILYFATVFLFQKQEHIIRLFKFALAASVFLVVFVAYGILNGQGIWSEYTPLSTEGSRLLALTHSFYLSLSYICLLSYLIYRKKEIHPFFYFLLFIWLAGIAGSMMRHLWIGVIIGIAAVYLIAEKEKRKSLGRLFLNYSIFVVIVASSVIYFSSLFPWTNVSQKTAVFKDIVSQRIYSFTQISSDESSVWRTTVWKEALKEYTKSPVLGIGFGQRIGIEIGTYHDFVEVKNLHNSPLVVLVQMGVVPFVIFLWLVWSNFAKIWTKRNEHWIFAGLLAMFVLYLAVIFFQPYLDVNVLGIFFWIILGLINSRQFESCKVA